MSRDHTLHDHMLKYTECINNTRFCMLKHTECKEYTKCIKNLHVHELNTESALRICMSYVKIHRVY